MRGEPVVDGVGGDAAGPGHAGALLADLFGGAAFPAVGDDERVDVTLGSRDFYWLVLTDARREAPLP